MQNNGASLRDRATRPSDQAPAGLGDTASVPSAVVVPGELYAFLMGEGPLEGVWFNDLHKGLPGRFWWRALLSLAKRDVATGAALDQGMLADRQSLSDRIDVLEGVVQQAVLDLDEAAGRFAIHTELDLLACSELTREAARRIETRAALHHEGIATGEE